MRPASHGGRSPGFDRHGPAPVPARPGTARSPPRPPAAQAGHLPPRVTAADRRCRRSQPARSVPDARSIADALVVRGVRLVLGSSVYDLLDPMRVFFNILATFADFEADLIRLRTREGMAIAWARGKSSAVSSPSSPNGNKRTPPHARQRRELDQRFGLAALSHTADRLSHPRTAKVRHRRPATQVARTRGQNPPLAATGSLTRTN